MEYRVSRFPMPSRFLLTANEKDFSLALEMTGRESGILASLPSHAGKALVRGHSSPSFLWKEVPRRGGGWLTLRNKKEGACAFYVEGKSAPLFYEGRGGTFGIFLKK